jgi:hypothetical protein
MEHLTDGVQNVFRSLVAHGDWLTNATKGGIHQSLLRGRLHVSESAYESPYDSVHDSLGNRIGIQFFFCHPLQ